jgi:hypothetical protein
MDRNQAISRINEDLRDSGNGDRTFETILDRLADAYYEAVAADDDFVFVKPSSGYELEIEIDVVKIALGVVDDRRINLEHELNYYM